MVAAATAGLSAALDVAEVQQFEEGQESPQLTARLQLAETGDASSRMLQLLQQQPWEEVGPSTVVSASVGTAAHGADQGGYLQPSDTAKTANTARDNSIDHCESEVAAGSVCSKAVSCEGLASRAGTALPSGGVASLSSDSDSQTGTRSSTAASSVSAASSQSSTDSAATDSSDGSAAAATAELGCACCGNHVLALQQFQQALVLLSGKCFPRIANAARAWKLLIDRHVQPLADKKRSRCGWSADNGWCSC